jgi:arsenate reductase (glutaredoxin)
MRPVPSEDPVEVQIFGSKKDPNTRKALRFFAERRIRVHFVDLQERAAALGELKRFAQKFGVQALIDREARSFRDNGFEHARFSDERWLDKLVENPLMLRMPLVRFQQRLTLGPDEAVWLEWTRK